MLRKSQFYSVFLSFFLFLISGPSKGDILYVPDDYNTIQGAINASVLDDTVIVEEGDYPEALTIFDHAVTLASRFFLDGDTSHIALTRILGTEDQGEESRPLTIENVEDTVYVIGLTFTEANIIPEGLGGGLSATNCNLYLLWNNITNNVAHGSGGARLNWGNYIIKYNRIEDNSARYSFGGLTIIWGTYLLEYNTITGNETHEREGNNVYDGGGVLIGYGSGIVRNNLIQENFASGDGGGVEVYSYDTWIFEGNRFERNVSMTGAALSIFRADSVIIRNNLFLENSAEDIEHADGGAIRTHSNHNYLSIYNNTFDSNSASNSSGALLIAGECILIGNVFYRNTARQTSTVYFVSYPDTVAVHGSGNIFLENIRIFHQDYTYRGAVSAGYRTVLEFRHNDFIDNGIAAAAPNGIAEMEMNYWGDESGPYHPVDNIDGEGDTARADVNVIPYLEAPCTDLLHPDVDTPEHEHDFGGVMVDSSFTWEMLVQNKGHDTLTVSSIISSDSAFIPEVLDTFRIERHWYKLVEITFQPTEIVQYTGEITIGSDDPDEPEFTVEVTGSGAGIPDKVESGHTAEPLTFEIERIYPNPFNPELIIRITLPESSNLKIRLINILGEEVAVVADSFYSQGYHNFTLRKENLSSGVYFIEAVVPGKMREVRKVILLR